jgi:hypothetical protein
MSEIVGAYEIVTPRYAACDGQMTVTPGSDVDFDGLWDTSHPIPRLIIPRRQAQTSR